MNNLICWKESRTKKWDMIKDQDRDTFLLNLLTNPKVDKHTIFIIPVNSIFSAIWLWTETHKSGRVDFYHFHEDFGVEYKKPVPASDMNKRIVDDIENRQGKNTKYGWISPDGRYFHCNYQGHSTLAHNICYGMIDTDNSELYLEEHGWCKIYKPLSNNQYSVYVGGKHTITDAQMKTLIKMGLENAHGISAMLVKD